MIYPTPVEEIETGDVIRHRHYEWRVTEIRSFKSVQVWCYKVRIEQIGGPWHTVLTYFTGEKLPLVRQATVAETAAHTALRNPQPRRIT